MGGVVDCQKDAEMDVRNLSTTQISHLSPAFMAALTEDQIEGLTEEQVAYRFDWFI